MAKSEVRKPWKEFKKRYPVFEKSKNFKSDFGPQLDKLRQKCDALYDDEEEKLETVQDHLKKAIAAADKSDK